MFLSVVRFSDRTTEERLKSKPNRLMRKWSEPQDAPVSVAADARAKTRFAKPLLLLLGAGGAGVAVVVRVYSVPAALHRPD
jgi:hypothetical protein